MEARCQFTVTYKGKHYPCVHADPQKYPLAAGRANRCDFSVGYHSGKCEVLVTRAAVEAFKDASGTFAITLDYIIDGVDSIRKNFQFLRLLQSVKVSQGAGNGDPNSVYMLTFVDVRYYADRWSGFLKRFNCRSFGAGGGLRAWLIDTLNGQSRWTPNQIAKEMWEACGVLGKAPNFRLAGPAADNLHYMGGSAWGPLNKLLAHHGKVIVYDPFKGGFTVETYRGRQGIASALPLQDSDPSAGGATVLPKFIDVYFPSQYIDHGCEEDTTVIGNYLTTSQHRIRIRTKNKGAPAGTTVALHDSTPALMYGSGFVQNAGNLQLRARVLASGWARIHGSDANARKHGTFSGLHPDAKPGATLSRVVWRDYGTAMGGLCTDLYALPIERNSDGSWFGPGDDENYLPPDFARKTWPTYSRLENVAVITTGYENRYEEEKGQEKKTGDELSPMFPGTKIYGGFTERVDALSGDLEIRDAVFIMFATSTKARALKAKMGQRLMGRHSGVFAPSGDPTGDDALPLYVVTEVGDKLSAGTDCQDVNDILIDGKPPPPGFDSFLTPGGLPDVKRITARYNSGLVMRPGVAPGEALLDFAVMDPGYVLNSRYAAAEKEGDPAPVGVNGERAGTGVPVWTDTPTLAGGLRVGEGSVGYIRISGGAIDFGGEEGQQPPDTFWQFVAKPPEGESLSITSSKQTWLQPCNCPEDPGEILLADSMSEGEDGDSCCVQLRWSKFKPAIRSDFCTNASGADPGGLTQVYTYFNGSYRWDTLIVSGGVIQGGSLVYSGGYGCPYVHEQICEDGDAFCEVDEPQILDLCYGWQQNPEDDDDAEDEGDDDEGDIIDPDAIQA